MKLGKVSLFQLLLITRKATAGTPKIAKNASKPDCWIFWLAWFLSSSFALCWSCSGVRFRFWLSLSFACHVRFFFAAARSWAICSWVRFPSAICWTAFCPAVLIFSWIGAAARSSGFWPMAIEIRVKKAVAVINAKFSFLFHLCPSSSFSNYWLN